jgi:RNA polymerase-binding transcription factor DksA
MNANQKQLFREKLIECADRLRVDVTNLRESTLAASGGQGTGELSNAPYHLGDHGTDEDTHGVNAVLLENEASLAGEVLSALRRLDEGSYGQCENCGGPVGEERLRAVPYARYCVECAQQLEESSPANTNAGRPEVPADTLAPEGEMGEHHGGRSHRELYGTAAVRAGGDGHAAGTPGGGTAFGGLAGSNLGHGDPDIAELEEAGGSGYFDREEAERREPRGAAAGRAGGAVGGTPAGKRAR